MNYIVLDLEWNQSNTGKEPEAGQIPFEIIDIGAVKLDDGRKPVGECGTGGGRQEEKYGRQENGCGMA